MNTLHAMAIGKLDAHDQAALLTSGEVSAAELVEAAILRIESLQPSLNALSHRAYEQARARVAKPVNNTTLAGVPYLLKEGLDYPGMPSRCASRARVNASNATYAFAYAQAMDAAGLIALGKTTTPEFALLPTTEPVLYGPARNPWSLEHSAGGSSGGAAVAVASGMVPLAHAADGGGSIRIPASCCGLVGLKPGRGGNVRARAHHFIEDLLVGDSLLSRSVRDVAVATRLAHPRQLDREPLQPIRRRLRIGVVSRNLFGDEPASDVAHVLESTAVLCEALGHSVRHVTLPFDTRKVAAAFRTLWTYLGNEIVEQHRHTSSTSLHERLERWTIELAGAASALSIADLDSSYEHVQIASRGMETFFGDCDVLLTPVLKSGPPRLGELAPTVPYDVLAPRMFEYVSYTPLQNLAGTPSISLPLFVAPDGLPIGSMFTAARGGEALLLQLALELEQAQPWKDRWPPHSVVSLATSASQPR